MWIRERLEFVKERPVASHRFLQYIKYYVNDVLRLPAASAETGKINFATMMLKLKSSRLYFSTLLTVKWFMSWMNRESCHVGRCWGRLLKSGIDMTCTRACEKDVSIQGISSYRVIRWRILNTDMHGEKLSPLLAERYVRQKKFRGHSKKSKYQPKNFEDTFADPWKSLWWWAALFFYLLF